MKLINKVLGILGAMILGILMWYVLNFVVIEDLIIPDPCYYHDKETTKLFDLFYEMTSGEGYHPSPTLFNKLLTLVLGITTGLFIYKLIARSSHQKSSPIAK